MSHRSAWSAIGVALLSLTLWGCSKGENSKQLAALENAYKDGILTKAEYEAKRTALVTQSKALSALDEALKAGVLTKEEYAAKKAALTTSASVPTPDPTGDAAPSATVADAPPAPHQAAVTPVNTAAAAPTVDPQGHTFRMKLVSVMDEHGFERPLPSLSFLIPLDWKMQGATSWMGKDLCNGIQTRLVANSPDGVSIETFPAYNWAWADDPRFLQQIAAQKAQFGMHACDVMQPVSAQDYLRRNLQRLRPGAQLVGFEPAPKLAESLAHQAQQGEQAARQYNLTQKIKSDATRARLRYTVDGKSVEEWIFAGVMITGTLGPSYNIQTMQPSKAWSYNCVAYTSALRAPQGQLDGAAKLFELISSTFRWNPEWQAKVSGHALAMQKIEQKGIADRSAIMAKSAEDTRKTQQEIYENRSKSEDRNSYEFGQYIRGVESYRDPNSGQTVELDANYGHAWVNNRGEYLLSDQSSFDPNALPGNVLDWKKMEVVKK